MSKPIITIHNVETGEVESREMNEAEFLIYETTQASIKTQEEEKAKTVADKAALLARLGITAEEAQLLLGGN
jgi:hypothetical protein